MFGRKTTRNIVMHGRRDDSPVARIAMLLSIAAAGVGVRIGPVREMHDRGHRLALAVERSERILNFDPSKPGADPAEMEGPEHH